MQTVSFAGSSYNIPSVRGDTPWSGLSDFVIAAASKAINTAGGNFTLLADINFGATFGPVSTYYKSRTANVASAGQLRLANADTIKWRNTLNNGDLSLSITTNNLMYEATKVLLSGAVVNADINAAAAIAYSKLNLAVSIVNADIAVGAAIVYSKLNLATSIVNADISASAAIARSKIATGAANEVLINDGSGNLASEAKLVISRGGTNSSTTLNNNRVMQSSGGAIVEATAITASRALVSDANGIPVAATTTTTEIGYVNGVTSAIQTQLGTKVATSGDETITGVKTFSGQLIGKGTATNDSPSAGYIGEYVEATAGTVAAASTGTYKDAANISLTAGDWDISANAVFSNEAGAWTVAAIGISTTIGNSSTGLTIGQNLMEHDHASSTTALVFLPFCIAPYRVSISSTTTYYLKMTSTFSSGTPAVRGARLSARRAR